MVRITAVSILFFALIHSASLPARAASARDAALFDALTDGGEAVVARVADDASLVLDDGRTVKLNGVRIPHTEPWRGKVLAFLRARAAGKIVRLEFDVRKHDRYGHSLAQVVFDDGTWLQARLVSEGLAEVESVGDNRVVIPRLLEIEARARAGMTGLWADSRYVVVPADEIAESPASHLGRFGIVEGRVVSVAERSNWSFVNFGVDWHTDFTIAVAAGDRKALRGGGIDLAALKGAKVRVRGWIRDWNGPLIEVTHAEQIERLAAPETFAETSAP
jgi:endonuclease YncB( thermonuclease family)